MYVTFGVTTNEAGEAVVYTIIDYKHYTETGRYDLSPDELASLYQP